MNSNKRIATFLGLTLVLSSVVISSAASTDSYEIANENSDAGNITIQEVGYSSYKKPGVGTRFIAVLEAKKAYKEKNVFHKDVFVDSCAKENSREFRCKFYVNKGK